MSEMIVVGELTSDKVYGIFKDACFRPDYEDQSILLEGIKLGQFYVSLQEATRFLLFQRYFVFKGEFDRLQMMNLVNEMNNSVVLTRFSLAEDDGQFFIMADYYLSYEEGITKMQLLNTVHWFEVATSGAVTQCDTEDLLE